ncbi:MAG: hypothetical protein COB04_04445 [Gammaproteobacteria bacterium]|nr:MAG: hypothetical protein COB04_04445 [Gammaproteobacteria bacterium]
MNGLLQTRQHIHSSGPSTINTHNAENDSDTSSNAAHGNNVLIVDDSLSVRRSLGQMMEDAGYKPILARDGLDAVEQLKNNHADLMLVDLEMPRMNGIELTRHLRNSKQHNATPIFMITSRSTSKHRNLAAHEGVTEYFTKPYTESDLLSKIHQHLHSQVESQ